MPLPEKKFRRRYISRWRFGAKEESDGIYDIPWTWRENVDWEIDAEGRYHFNVPRVIVEYSLERWRVGTEDWAATLDYALNILVVFIDDDSAWLLHERFAEEFLAYTVECEVKPGCFRIRGSEIKGWLIVQAKGLGIEYGPPVRVYAR